LINVLHDPNVGIEVVVEVTTVPREAADKAAINQRRNLPEDLQNLHQSFDVIPLYDFYTEGSFSRCCMAAYEPGLSIWTVSIICHLRDTIWTRVPLTASTEYAELFLEKSFLARMLIINADQVSFATASLAEEVRPEN
jgi:hypothetical protein